MKVAYLITITLMALVAILYLFIAKRTTLVFGTWVTFIISILDIVAASISKVIGDTFNFYFWGVEGTIIMLLALRILGRPRIQPLPQIISKKLFLQIQTKFDDETSKN